jgi:hypothetical protein
VTPLLENEEGCCQGIYHCEHYGFCASHPWCAAMPTLALFASSGTDADVGHKESLCLMYFHTPPVERCSCHICYLKWTSLVVFHHSTNTHIPRNSQRGLQQIVWYLYVESFLPSIRSGAPSLLDQVVSDSGWTWVVTLDVFWENLVQKTSSGCIRNSRPPYRPPAVRLDHPAVGSSKQPGGRPVRLVVGHSDR